MTKRRIAVVTGTRAEYGLLVPVMEAIKRRRELQLEVFVTGMHLLKRFGNTVKQIENDGWRVSSRVPLQGESDNIIGQSVGLGRAIEKFSREFSRLKIDVVLVLGDRIEVFAAAAAGFAGGRVVGHIHGGDAAVGVQDDVYRYAVTKLAHVHFAATPTAKERLLRQGEQGFRVYQTGSPSLDGLDEICCDNVSELSDYAGFDVCDDYVMVLQHPSGGTADQEHRRMGQTLGAAARSGLKMLVLYPNCDTGYSGIIEAGSEFCRKKRCRWLANMPRSIYLGLLRRCRTLVGNSSSGIIEASYFGVPCVNVGPRQAGRDRAGNVIDVRYGVEAVYHGIRLVNRRRGNICPSRYYGDGRASQRIATVLQRMKIDQRWIQKRVLA